MIRYNHILTENTVQKADPVKIYNKITSQKYKRQRSDEENSSNVSWSSMSPTQSTSASALTMADHVCQPYSPKTPMNLPRNHFITSTPAMATLAAATATAEPSINFAISFYKSMNAAPSPFTDSPIDASKLFCPPPMNMEMPPLNKKMPPLPMSMQTSTPSTDMNFISNFTKPSVRFPNAKSIISEPIYDSKRYGQLMIAEQANLLKFIEIHLPHFSLNRTYNQAKVRRVCRATDAEPANGIDNIEVKLRKAEYRQLNNLNSQRSRHKQKVARFNDALTAVFLRDRIASYERRVEKMIETILDPNGKH